jgi:dihydroorotate dehydrogenase
MFDYYRLIGPAMRRIDPETAHGLAIAALKCHLVPPSFCRDEAILACRVFDRDFPNPIGLAAGFDKNAEVPDAMLGQGFGFVEVGTVTPRPQSGNPRPRMFRLPEDEAAINRMGFNNQGMEAMAARLAKRRRQGIVGVNIGKNKDSLDAAADYEACVARLAPLADYMVINVSSPNTPGLRALQEKASLLAITSRARAAMPPNPPPLFLKIAPDLAKEDLTDIAAVALEGGVDGIVVSNTTITRPSTLKSHFAAEVGGLSGKPVFEMSNLVLEEMFRLVGGRLPLIGVGGVSSGRDAYRKIRAGASLVQLYTALIYQGPPLVNRIKRELAELLRRDGFRSVADAVGADHR